MSTIDDRQSESEKSQDIELKITIYLFWKAGGFRNISLERTNIHNWRWYSLRRISEKFFLSSRGLSRVSETYHIPYYLTSSPKLNDSFISLILSDQCSLFWRSLEVPLVLVAVPKHCISQPGCLWLYINRLLLSETLFATSGHVIENLTIASKGINAIKRIRLELFRRYIFKALVPMLSSYSLVFHIIQLRLWEQRA